MSAEAWIAISAGIVSFLITLASVVYFGGRHTAKLDNLASNFNDHKANDAIIKTELIRAKNDHERRITAVETELTITERHALRSHGAGE